MQNDVIRHEGFKLLRGRPNEHIAGKKRVPRIGRNKPDPDAMFRRGTRIKVLREQDLALQVIADFVGERRKAGLRKLLVDAAPPDIAACFGLIDDKFIGCRTAGVRPRGDDKRAVGREPAFTALKRQLDKGRSLEIGVNGPCAGQTRTAQRGEAPLRASCHQIHCSGLRLQIFAINQD